MSCVTAAWSPWPLATVDSTALEDGDGVAAGEALAAGLGDAADFAFDDFFGLAAGLDGLGVADCVPVEVVRFGATSSTWRNRSRAVRPTRFSTCCAPFPGTATVMMDGPCCWTRAPVKPAPLTRASMIDLASFISV